jgi:hypothetical protein
MKRAFALCAYLFFVKLLVQNAEQSSRSLPNHCGKQCKESCDRRSSRFDTINGRPMNLRNHPDFLKPLLGQIKNTSPREASQYDAGYEHEPIFKDSFGNKLDMGHTDACFLRPAFELVKSRKEGAVEIENVDRGSLFYTLQKLDNYWVLIQTKIDLYGWIGCSSEFVIIEDFEKFEEKFESLIKESVAEYEDEE